SAEVGDLAVELVLPCFPVFRSGQLSLEIGQSCSDRVKFLGKTCELAAGSSKTFVESRSPLFVAHRASICVGGDTRRAYGWRPLECNRFSEWPAPRNPRSVRLALFGCGF